MVDGEKDTVGAELKRIVKLLALIATSGQTSQTEQIKTLDKAGFRPVDISDMLGIPSNVVRARLSQLRKEEVMPSAKTKA